MQPEREERFCEHCDIALDRHPWTDDPEGCRVAAARERLLNDFWKLAR